MGRSCVGTSAVISRNELELELGFGAVMVVVVVVVVAAAAAVFCTVDDCDSDDACDVDCGGGYGGGGGCGCEGNGGEWYDGVDVACSGIMTAKGDGSVVCASCCGAKSVGISDADGDVCCG